MSIPVFESVPGVESPLLSMEGARTMGWTLTDSSALTSPSMDLSATRTRKKNVAKPQQGRSADQSRVTR